MSIDIVEYQNKEYVLRDIKLPEFGYVYIACRTLGDLLFQENLGYPSQAARYLDEKIFFFVEDNEIMLSDRKLRNLLIKENL